MRVRPSCLTILISSVFLTGCGGSAGDPDTGSQLQGFIWPAPEPGARPKVLLVGWDGVRPDVLSEVPTPNFDALAQIGAFSDKAVTARPTVSGPCWSSILTGVWPEKHGVTSNDFSPNRYEDFPDFLTRIETVDPELRTFAAADWLPLVTEESGGPLIGNEVDQKVVLNGYLGSWLNADSSVVDAALAELEVGDPDALFVYLGAPDEISHGTRSIGERYRASIATADHHLGKLVEAIRERPDFAREDWLVIVITDHGRTEQGGHGGDTAEETTIFFMASGPSVMSGRPQETPEVVDVAVTALTHLGIPVDPSWGMDGSPVGIGAPSPAPPDTLRVLAYNTHHGEGLDGVLDLERIGRLIASLKPDVVALQEIDRVVDRTGGVDQIGEYGRLTGMTPLFGAFMDYGGGQYGMGMLSRFPVEDWTNHGLPPGAEPRSALTARIRVVPSGREVVVSSIHFYRTEEERLAQAGRLMELLQGEEAPVVLAGDFNSTPGSPVMELLAREWTVPLKDGPPFSFSAGSPEREIDFILIRPQEAFRVLEYRVVDERVASDHRPVFMVLEMR